MGLTSQQRNKVWRMKIGSILTLTLAMGYMQTTWSQMPLPKQGSCPSGYHSSGNYCTPSSSSSQFAVPKVGSCPSGYHVSGNYCLANNENSKLAVVKQGSCPSGFHSSGDYCLKN